MPRRNQCLPLLRKQFIPLETPTWVKPLGSMRAKNLEGLTQYKLRRHFQSRPTRYDNNPGAAFVLDLLQ